jgi:hypothetical protein
MGLFWKNEPKSMEITTVIGCRNMCRYCPQTLLINEYGRHSDAGVMTFNTFKTCLDKIPKDVRIDFSGMAEPWLNKDCTKMLLYAHEQGFKHIAVFTTCMGMTEKDLRSIWHIPFDVFYLHLADKDRNSKIEVTNQYLKLLELINKTNIKNKKYMTMGKLHPKLKKTFSSIVEEVKMISRAGNLETTPTINKFGPIKCCWPEGLKHNGLLPNGDVLLCSMDYGMTRVIGNLLTNNYDDLFRGKAFKQIQRLLDDPNKGDLICRHCEYATENR